MRQNHEVLFVILFLRYCLFVSSIFPFFLVSKKYHEYEDFRDQHHIDVLKQCNVIGMTVTGAAVRANQLGRGV